LSLVNLIHSEKNSIQSVAVSVFNNVFRLSWWKERTDHRKGSLMNLKFLGKQEDDFSALLYSLWNSAKVVVLDSGFCVLKALIQQKGVYAAALVKKYHYWPKHIKGEEIKEYFKSK
jgi:hypothetical protein